jgi:hypothetical protein
MTLAGPMFPPRASPASAPGAVSACPAPLILESRPGASQTLASESEPQAAHPTCSWGYVMEDDEWRRVFDKTFDLTRARDLMIAFVGGEPAAQLRDQFAA